MVAPKKLKLASLVTLQVLVLCFAAVCMFYGQRNFAIRCIGILAVFAGLALVRSTRRLRFGAPLENKPTFSVKWWQWLVGSSFVLLLLAAIWWLSYDAATGYTHGLWPIYAFIASVLLCGCWWGGIFVRWFMQWF